MRRKTWLHSMLSLGLLLGVFVYNASAEKVEIRVSCGPAGGGLNFRNQSITSAIERANPEWEVSGITGPSMPAAMGMMSR